MSLDESTLVKEIESGMQDVDNYDEADETDYEGPLVRLQDGLDIESLCNNNGTEFEVNEEDTGENFRQYDPSDVYKYYRDDMLCGDDADESADNDADMSRFQKLVSQMTNVTTDGGVRKKIVREGVGERVFPRAHVTIHYNSYLEDSDEPFDSSRLRGKPLSFDLAAVKYDDSESDGSEDLMDVLPGFNIAVSTMRKNELTYFFFEPEYFMRDGCPPRIPANAQTIHVIELISFTERGSSEYFNLPQNERKHAPFELALGAARKAKADGKIFVNRKDYRQANRAYRRSLKILDDHHLQNEEEEKISNQMKITLYQNLCVVNLQLPEQYGTDAVTKFSSLGLALDSKNYKLFYFRGKAWYLKGLYDAASKDVVKAKQLAPGSKTEISQLLAKIECKNKLMKESEKLMYKKMFDPAADKSSKTSSSGSTVVCKSNGGTTIHKPAASGDEGKSEQKFPPATLQFFTDKLSEFKSGVTGCEEITLDGSLFTCHDIDCLKHVTKKLDLLIHKITHQEGSASYRISKKPV